MWPIEPTRPSQKSRSCPTGYSTDEPPPQRPSRRPGASPTTAGPLPVSRGDTGRSALPPIRPHGSGIPTVRVRREPVLLAPALDCCWLPSATEAPRHRRRCRRGTKPQALLRATPRLQDRPGSAMGRRDAAGNAQMRRAGRAPAEAAPPRHDPSRPARSAARIAPSTASRDRLTPDAAVGAVPPRLRLLCLLLRRL
jgi:hypothetical protein